MTNRTFQETVRVDVPVRGTIFEFNDRTTASGQAAGSTVTAEMLILDKGGVEAISISPDQVGTKSHDIQDVVGALTASAATKTGKDLHNSTENSLDDIATRKRREAVKGYIFGLLAGGGGVSLIESIIQGRSATLIVSESIVTGLGLFGGFDASQKESSNSRRKTNHQMRQIATNGAKNQLAKLASSGSVINDNEVVANGDDSN